MVEREQGMHVNREMGNTVYFCCMLSNCFVAAEAGPVSITLLYWSVA